MKWREAADGVVSRQCHSPPSSNHRQRLILLVQGGASGHAPGLSRVLSAPPDSAWADEEYGILGISVG